jgi:hypothetical protein
MLNTLTIQNSLTEGCKVSQIMPFLKIIAQQQKLGSIKKLSNYNKAYRILKLSINHN